MKTRKPKIKKQVALYEKIIKMYDPFTVKAFPIDEVFKEIKDTEKRTDMTLLEKQKVYDALNKANQLNQYINGLPLSPQQGHVIIGLLAPPPGQKKHSNISVDKVVDDVVRLDEIINHTIINKTLNDSKDILHLPTPQIVDVIKTPSLREQLGYITDNVSENVKEILIGIADRSLQLKDLSVNVLKNVLHVSQPVAKSLLDNIKTFSNYIEQKAGTPEVKELAKGFENSIKGFDNQGAQILSNFIIDSTHTLADWASRIPLKEIGETLEPLVEWSYRPEVGSDIGTYLGTNTNIPGITRVDKDVHLPYIGEYTIEDYNPPDFGPANYNEPYYGPEMGMHGPETRPHNFVDPYTDWWKVEFNPGEWTRN